MKYLIALLVMLSIAFAACTPAPGGQAPDNAAEGNDATEDDSAREDDSTTEDEPEEKVAPSDDASGDFMDYMARKSALAYMVEYRMTASGNGVSSSGTMTQYLKGDKFRTDTFSQGVEARTFMLDNEAYSCMNQDGSWSCLKIGEAKKSDVDEVEENPEGKQITSLPPKQVAGVTAECFRIIVDNGMVDYCLSPEGVPLYIKSEGSSDGVSYMSELTAVEYGTSVSDNVFDLPAEPQDMQDLEALMEQYGK